MATDVCQSAPATQAAEIAHSPFGRPPWRMLVVLVLLGAALRLPGVTRPLVGHFATKNAIYAMIARNYARGRSPLWLPTIDCMAGGDRGWHLLEVPLSAYLAAAGWATLGGSLDVWGRVVSLAFSVASVVLLFLMVRRWHGERAAFVAAMVFALSPISVLCGQSFMLESSAVFFMLLTIRSCETWLATGRAIDWLAATIGTALLLCTKIYLVVTLLPLAVMVARQVASDKSASRWRWLAGGFLLLLFGAAPAVAWCVMVARLASPEHPLSCQVYYSLVRSTAVHSIPSPLLVSPEFYRRLLLALAGAGLTPIGLLLAAIGALHPRARRHAGWLLATGLLLAFLPGKFFELRYYLLFLIPPLAVLAGLGWDALRVRVPAPRIASALLLLAGLGCSLRGVIGPAWSTPPEDRSVVAAAAALHQLARTDDRIATLHGAAPDLLYYCDRAGWALSTNDRHLDRTLERCRREGARWLIAADLAPLERQPAAAYLARLHVVAEGDDYRIYRLPDDVPRASIAPNDRAQALLR